MKRKDYQKPSMQVVEVKPMGMLMTSDPAKGGQSSTRTPYDRDRTDGGSGTDDEEWF